MHVPAHLPSRDLEPVLARALADVERLAPSLSTTPDLFGHAQLTALQAVGAGLYTHADQEVVLRALRFVRDIGIGAMLVTFPQLAGTPFELDGVVRPLPTRHTPIASPTLWRRAFYAALILRDEQRSEWLVGIPGSVLLNERVRARPYAYMGVNVLRGMRVDAEGWQDVLAKAFVRAETDHGLQEFDRKIVLPDLKIVDQIYAGVPALDRAIAQALEAHKTFYSEGERAADAAGMVALGPLALAIWARSCGFSTTVESTYLPGWLLTTSWWPRKKG